MPTDTRTFVEQLEPDRYPRSQGWSIVMTLLLISIPIVLLAVAVVAAGPATGAAGGCGGG